LDGEQAGKQTIFLLHGWGGYGGQFSAFVEPLVQAGFRVVIPDLPAHGGSAGRITNAFEMRQAVLDLVQHVGQPDAVIAHSFGAMVTALALDAGLAPKVCAFVAPMTSFNFAVQSFATTLGLSDAAREHMLQHLEARFGISSAGMEVAETAGSRFGRGSGTRGVPLLVVHDTGDARVPIELGRNLVQAWPNAELHSTSGLGHQRVLNDASVVDKLVRFVTVTARRAGAHPATALRA
jgi:pimeloyl-ACP methyl ester carboxylesterase